MEDRSIRKVNRIKISVVLQILFALIGIFLSVYDILGDPGLPDDNAITSTGPLISIGASKQNTEYYILGIHIFYLLIAFIGYPGYKYEKTILIILHAYLTAIPSVCILVYFTWGIIDEDYYFFKYLLSPLLGIIVSSLGLLYIHNRFTESKGESCEIPKESFLEGECSNCKHRVLVIRKFTCSHGVCEECAVTIKLCNICEFDTGNTY